MRTASVVPETGLKAILQQLDADEDARLPRTLKSALPSLGRVAFSITPPAGRASRIEEVFLERGAVLHPQDATSADQLLDALQGVGSGALLALIVLDPSGAGSAAFSTEGGAAPPQDMHA